MEDVDLDYSVEEIKEEENKLPSWIYTVAKALMFLIIIGLGILLLFGFYKFVGWIADMVYVPSEKELAEPKKPLTVYEINRNFDITIIEDSGRKAKVMVEKVVLAYDESNEVLPSIMNTRGANIERIVREAISGQRISDLINSSTRESILKNTIILDVNKYLLGVERPINELTGEKVKKGDPVKIKDIIYSDNIQTDRIALKDIVYSEKDKSFNTDFVKIRILATNTEGWLPINALKVNNPDNIKIGMIAEVAEEYKLRKGRRTGGQKGVRSGIIDVYFPKGFKVFPLNNNY